MVGQAHLRILNRGVAAWNEWRRAFAADQMRPNLTGADLSGRNLGAVDFQGADLAGVDLTGSWLAMADLDSSNLRDASLKDAKLFRTNLSNANLIETDFAFAELSRTVFGDVDLRAALGLDLVHHIGPSLVGVDTLYRSGGLIPEAFLRGVGVPQTLIDFSRGLIRNTSQLSSCFISYSTQDQEFANQLHADLQDNGVRCWFAAHDVQGGKKLHEQIDNAIRTHDRLLLILSPDSMKSEWVKTEIRKARRRERIEFQGGTTKNKRVLFPIGLVSFSALREWELFDSDEGRDLAAEVREYYIPDFTNWKRRELYQMELQKLLRGLRVDLGE